MHAESESRPAAWRFRLRYTASLLLAGGLFYCAARLESVPAGYTAEAPGPADAGLPTVTEAVTGRLAIVIDAGHGGVDPGTTGSGEHEKRWTLIVSLALAEELRRRGLMVELTRSADMTVPLLDRSGFANQAARRAFVSIHFNAGGPEAAGIETYYAWPKNPEVMARMPVPEGFPPDAVLHDDRGRLLAVAIQAAACAVTGSKDRGVRNEPNYSVISRTQCPAVLVECGFLTNLAECEAVKSEAWRARLVQGLANGIEAWAREAEAPGFGMAMEASDKMPAIPVLSPAANANP